MTMPHKICPQCGQPAVVAMTQCRRCGGAFSAVPPAGSADPTAPRPTEAPRAQQAALQRRRRIAPLMLSAALVLGALLLGGTAFVVNRALLQSGRFDADKSTGGSPLNAAPADTAASPHKLSFFVETPSAEEMPTLTFRYMAAGTLTLTLRDRYGHVYRALSREAELAKLQVPAGDYSVSIDSDNPHIRPNWGDAAFRKFKSYDADFVVGASDTRIHLGD